MNDKRAMEIVCARLFPDNERIVVIDPAEVMQAYLHLRKRLGYEG